MDPIPFYILFLLLLLVGVTWSACSRCDKCRGWCVDDEDCRRRQDEKKH